MTRIDLAKKIAAKFQAAKAPKVSPPDSGIADQAARESESRGKALKKARDEVLKLGAGLGKKTQKAFDKAYDEIHELGEQAAKSAERLIETYGESIAMGTRGEDKTQREAAIEMLDRRLRQWKAREMEHFRPKDGPGKMVQAEHTFGYVVELESFVRHISRALKGDYIVDESWAE